MLDTTTLTGRAPLLALATAASVVALTAIAPQADAFVIDDWTEDAQAVFADGTGSDTATTTLPSTSTDATEVQRTLNIDVTANPIDSGPDSGSAVVVGDSPSGGFFIWGNGPGAESTWSLSYSFDDVDLTGFSAFSFGTVTGAAVGATPDPLEVGVTVNGTSINNPLTIAGGSADNGKELVAAFADFSGVDFGAVNSLEIALSSPSNSGVQMTGGVAAVPLPGALPLFATALAGLGYVARRRRQAAAA